MRERAAIVDLAGHGRILLTGADRRSYLQGLLTNGIRVPQDVALIGFDDVADAALAHPSLSTVRQPIAALGRTMSERLLARIAGADPPRSSVLPVELVRRQSA